MRITIDRNRPLAAQPGSGHNRWHPDIEPIARVALGEVVTLETRDGADGQLGRDSTHDDVLSLDLGLSHPLTGPVFIDGAKPGDVLEVEILGYESADFGVTPIYPGFGFLADLFTEPFLAKWTLAGDVARSSEIPGVAIPAAIFAGVLGVAPSHELMRQQLNRERELETRGFDVAPSAPSQAVPETAAGGLRTIPPRENGGNLDIRQLVAGSCVRLPVFVPGALFSVGDLHFAQGDGEVCGSGIEIAGAVTVRFSLLAQGSAPLRFPTFVAPPSPSTVMFVTTGISLTEDGVAEWMDVRLAARRALLELISYLCERLGVGREAAYVLASVAGDLRISQLVDTPHPLVSAAISLDIFDV